MYSIISRGPETLKPFYWNHEDSIAKPFFPHRLAHVFQSSHPSRQRLRARVVVEQSVEIVEPVSLRRPREAERDVDNLVQVLQRFHLA